MATTIDSVINRIACNATSRIGALDVLSHEQIQIFKGVPVHFQCALFKGAPSATTFVDSITNITQVDLYVRKSSANGAILIHKTLVAGADITKASYALWATGTDQQFTFNVTDVETVQNVPSDGTLQVYFAVIVTVTDGTQYIAAFGYGQLVDVGLTNLGGVIPVGFLNVYVDGTGAIQNPALDFTGVTVTGLSLGPFTTTGTTSQWFSAYNATTRTFTKSQPTFTDLAAHPTTVGGYGITDFNSLGDARWSVLAHTHTFASLTSKPTTISGYGITDFNSLGDARWQAANAGLTSLAGASGTNTLYYRSAANTWSAVTLGSHISFSGGTLDATGMGGGIVNVAPSGTYPVTTDGAGNLGASYILQTTQLFSLNVPRFGGTVPWGVFFDGPNWTGDPHSKMLIGRAIIFTSGDIVPVQYINGVDKEGILIDDEHHSVYIQGNGGDSPLTPAVTLTDDNQHSIYIGNSPSSAIKGIYLDSDTVVLSNASYQSSVYLSTDTGGELVPHTSFPTFNQNTTGSAASLTTGRTIGMTGDVSWTSASFNGTGNVTGTSTIGATKVTSAMLNSDVFSTAHSWSGGQTFTAPNIGAATGTSVSITGAYSTSISGAPMLSSASSVTTPGWITMNDQRSGGKKWRNQASVQVIGDFGFYNESDALVAFVASANGTMKIARGLYVGNVAATDPGSGVIDAATAYNVAGTKVVGARDTGWTAMTGTPDKATSYATSTVTLAQLAGRVMAIQTALTTHGLLGA